MHERSYEAGQDQAWKGTTQVGEIANKVQEKRLNRYGYVMRREEHYVGRRAMEIKGQGRRQT